MRPDRILLSCWIAWGLAGSGCTSSKAAEEVKVELRKRVVDDTEERSFFTVRRNRLVDAGITVDVARVYVQGFFDGMEKLIGEAAVEALGGEKSPPTSVSPRPPWLHNVFPEGIPLEFITVKGGGSPKVEKLVLPVH